MEALNLEIELITFMICESILFVFRSAFGERFEISNFDDILGIILFIFCHFSHDIFLCNIEGFTHVVGRWFDILPKCHKFRFFDERFCVNFPYENEIRFKLFLLPIIDRIEIITGKDIEHMLLLFVVT